MGLAGMSLAGTRLAGTGLPEIDGAGAGFRAGLVAARTAPSAVGGTEAGSAATGFVLRVRMRRGVISLAISPQRCASSRDSARGRRGGLMRNAPRPGARRDRPMSGGRRLRDCARPSPRRIAGLPEIRIPCAQPCARQSGKPDWGAGAGGPRGPLGVGEGRETGATSPETARPSPPRLRRGPSPAEGGGKARRAIPEPAHGAAGFGSSTTKPGLVWRSPAATPAAAPVPT